MTYGTSFAGGFRRASAPTRVALVVATLVALPCAVQASPQAGRTVLRIEATPVLLVGVALQRSASTAVAVADIFHRLAPVGAAPSTAPVSRSAPDPAWTPQARLRASAAYSNGVIHFHADPEPRRMADGTLRQVVLVEHY